MKLVFFLLFLSLIGNDSSDNGIPYRNLTYADFRATVPKNEPGIAARTTCQMILDYTELDGSYRYAVTAYFLPYSSFIRKGDRQVLLHEQTHFQIAYIASLKCMQELRPLQNGDSTTLGKAQQDFSRYSEGRDKLNEKYDEETNHGLKVQEEGDWEFRINREMKQLLKLK